MRAPTYALLSSPPKPDLVRPAPPLVALSTDVFLGKGLGVGRMLLFVSNVAGYSVDCQFLNPSVFLCFSHSLSFAAVSDTSGRPPSSAVATVAAAETRLTVLTSLAAPAGSLLTAASHVCVCSQSFLHFSHFFLRSHCDLFALFFFAIFTHFAVFHREPSSQQLRGMVCVFFYGFCTSPNEHFL